MRRARILAIVTLIVAIPLLYALAAGPLVYLRSIERPLLSDEGFALIYHPLIRAESRIPPLGRAMDLYVSWWERPHIAPPIAPITAASRASARGPASVDQ